LHYVGKSSEAKSFLGWSVGKGCGVFKDVFPALPLLEIDCPGKCLSKGRESFAEEPLGLGMFFLLMCVALN